MFVIFATTKAHNKGTMFCASFLSYNLSCEFNLPGPGLLEGIMELLLVPCGPGVLAPADQRCLFLTLPARSHIQSCSWPREDRLVWRFCRKERGCRDGRRPMAPVDRGRGPGGHKSEKAVGPGEKASDPVRKPPWCMGDR